MVIDIWSYYIPINLFIKTRIMDIFTIKKMNQIVFKPLNKNYLFFFIYQFNPIHTTKLPLFFYTFRKRLKNNLKFSGKNKIYYFFFIDMGRKSKNYLCNCVEILDVSSVGSDSNQMNLNSLSIDRIYSNKGFLTVN